MKPFSYYSKPEIIYPDKLDYIIYYVYDKGKVLWEGKVKSKSDLEKEYPDAVIQVVFDKQAYYAHCLEYRQKFDSLDQEFMNDIFEEFGVSDNPKRFKCYNYAYGVGHAFGHKDVYNVFEEIVDLIKD